MMRTLSTTTEANWKLNPSGIGSLIVSSVTGTLVPQPARLRNAMGELAALTTVWLLGSIHANVTGVNEYVTACAITGMNRPAKNNAVVAAREYCFASGRSTFKAG